MITQRVNKRHMMRHRRTESKICNKNTTILKISKHSLEKTRTQIPFNQEMPHLCSYSNHHH